MALPHRARTGIDMASTPLQCYRTPELAEGFSGWIATQQIWMLFDAVPIAFSSFVLK